ncbi:HMG domain-containing protein 3-like isoform X3 [Rhopilema esculentum]|uniref:HMG domain-containing protein 3-like isoform X3 n=1 Tax=Rhopilema esculentum TaxID=499914 RepID=UPI0031DAE745
MKSMAIGEISDLDTESLIGIASSCKIRTQGKSKDMLRIQLQELYATILVGSSSCHGFTKSPGHTGGFYHIVCLHGTTVCSKFMILTESVRDAADLWLSLRYPPVLFICDTPCTFVRHMNLRDPDMARITWGENDGCFEKPKLEAIPTLRRYGRKWIMIECSVSRKQMVPYGMCWDVRKATQKRRLVLRGLHAGETTKEACCIQTKKPLRGHYSILYCIVLYCIV